MTNESIKTNKQQFSKTIRELRQEIGLTQEKLASVLGVSCLTVNRWENGRTQPSPLAIKQIEKVLLVENDCNK